MNIQVERDILTVAHLKKLQEEIDMLRKQKIYLQSKLREKNNDQKNKWKVNGYYITNQGSWTIMINDSGKEKMVKGIK